MAISNNDFQKAVKLRHLRVIAALSDLKLLAIAVSPGVPLPQFLDILGL